MHLQATGLTLRYGDHSLFSELSLAVASGNSLAITGPSGVGKSSLLRLLAGLDRPDAGQILWDAQDISCLKPDARCQARLARAGLLEQDPDLDERLSARDNVLLPAAFRAIDAADKRADELLAAVGLGKLAEQKGGVLSGGQQVRVALARCLLTRPSVVLADEPTASLDQATAAAVSEVLFERQRQDGFTLVLATHDGELAARCTEELRLC